MGARDDPKRRGGGRVRPPKARLAEESRERDPKPEVRPANTKAAEDDGDRFFRTYFTFG